jgi:hypothetical protein
MLQLHWIAAYDRRPGLRNWRLIRTVFLSLTLTQVALVSEESVLAGERWVDSRDIPVAQGSDSGLTLSQVDRDDMFRAQCAAKKQGYNGE